MKNINRIVLALMAAVALVACDKHDVLDDKLVYVGEMAPQLFWTVSNTTVSAGDSVPFSAQYYTTGDYPLSHLEVWYNVKETESKTLSLPWISSTTKFTVASEATVVRRISQSICRYEHNEDWKVEYGVSAIGDTTYFKPYYKFDAKFPTSNTLGVVSLNGWECDSVNVIKYFGEDFMDTYKQQMLDYFRTTDTRVIWSDIRNLVYYQWEIDPNTKDTVPVESANKGVRSSQENYNLFLANTTTYHDPNSDTDYKDFTDHTLPACMDAILESLDFKDMITYGGEQSVSYSRKYGLDAQLKCYDEKGNAGLSLITEISLN